MCIASSVGRRGQNGRLDVKTVQLMLNLNLSRIIPLRALDEDGKIDSRTINAIEEFQRRILHQKKPDGRVDPGGATLRALRKGMLLGFTKEKLKGTFINATNHNINRYFYILRQKMRENDIYTPRRVAHFLAQLGKESGELRTAEEDGSGDQYEGDVDLGNTHPGDGRRFKGRGLIQLTGRYNYTNYSHARGKDYLKGDRPKLLATNPHVAVDVSCWFWKIKHLNRLADADDVMAITKTINGGYAGITERRAILSRAKCFFPVR